MLAAAFAVLLAVVAAVAVFGSVRPEPKADVPPRPVYAIGIRTLRLVDESRVAVLADGTTQTRSLTTYISYPAVGSPRSAVRPGARRAGARPLPLVIFAHGFGFTPGTYSALIDAWVRSGYVVAAPMFPLENAYAPGGPYRRDLPNQPGDVSFVIDRLLEADAAPSGPLSGLIDRRRIAVAGHSDGGATALALAYTREDADPRIRATIVLSGALIPGVPATGLGVVRRPLLAVQGTADRINPPADTTAFWSRAAGPKYLLKVAGAGHLAPYTRPRVERTAVFRATLAFLDRYLRGDRRAGRTLRDLRGQQGRYTLLARP